jgi:solute carrier family 35, member F1/2
MADHVDTDSKKSLERAASFNTAPSLPAAGDGPETEAARAPARPPIRFNSPKAFASSIGERFKSIWTKRFALALLAGQIISLCITCTNVTTTELVNRNWALPTTQSFFL